jgi:hypothetical protein
VFSPDSIVAAAQPLELVAFGFVDDDGVLHEAAEIASVRTLDYGCGMFEFLRPIEGGVK